jgi:hypothetical protein
MAKQKVFIELTSKNDNGTKRLAHHGRKWELLRRVTKPFPGALNVLYYCLISNDGKKILWVQYQNDPDFTVRGL